MHAVSPVHVYVESQVKTPMTGTNIDETTVKNLNKEKQKKSSKVTSNKAVSKKVPIQKKSSRTRSYSPKDNQSVTIKLNAVTNKKSSLKSSNSKKINKENSTIKYDEIPERDNQHGTKSSCEVCVEAKQRSRSPSSVKYALNDSSMHDQNNDFHDQILNASTASSAASFNAFFKKNHSRSLENLNNETYTLENKNDSKVLFDFDTSDPLNRKTILKRNFSEKDSIQYEPNMSNHEILIHKLIECEGVGNDITKQLSSLKDFLKWSYNENQLNSVAVKRLENDRDMLMKNLETYENVNRELKDVIYELKAIEKNDYRRNLTNDSLIKHIDGLEEENNHLKKLLLDLEKNVMKFGDQNDQFKLENSALCNLKLSLENNRAHLQKQLNTRESEINRLTVKLRIADRKTERLKSELDEFKKLGGRDSKTDKITAKELDAQTKQLIAKLQNELKQKDVLIKELVHESKKFDSESNSKMKDIGGENVRSRTSMESARAIMDKNKDEKLKNAENEIGRLNMELENAHSILRKFEENEAAKLEGATENGDATNDSEAKRVKHFREMELDKVRSKLQQRLNELEPLPELLKNTELKLHEALKKQKEYESHNGEQERVISNLNVKIEKLETLIAEKEKALNNAISSSTNHDIGFSQMIKNNYPVDSNLIERKIKSLEEENHELFRQLTIKDETLRDANNRLTNKTNESTSLSRQLELALNDSKSKEEHIKDKYASKERSLQTRCIELETQLSKLKIDHNSNKRDKEEIEYKHRSQLKDLKDKLDQSYATNKSMQNYVNFLKNSYSSMFNDNTLFNATSNPFSSNNSDSNFMTKTGSTNFF